MSISPVNRSPYFVPASSTFNSKSPAEVVERTPEPQPRNDLWQQLLSDSFEQGPSVSGSSGVDQLLGEFKQLMDVLETQLLGSQGGDPFEAPQDLAAPAPQEFAASNTPNSPTNPTHPTYDSDAGPGFGAPSAGSTEQVDPSTPWLAKNNVGSPYNSNMQLIEPSQKSQFKYTNTFTNNTNEP